MPSPKEPKQFREHQLKSTLWVGAKEELQLVNKEDPFQLDPSMEEPKVDSEEKLVTHHQKKTFHYSRVQPHKVR